MTSILSALYQHAERTPDRLLFAFLNSEGRVKHSLSYSEFVQRTADIALHLRRTRPMPRGARVLLAYPPGLEVICAFFACVRLGLVPVPVYPPASPGFRAALSKMSLIARDCQASAVLTDRAYYWSMKLNQAKTTLRSMALGSDLPPTLQWIVSSDAERANDGALVDVHSDLLFLQYTSGSTHHPKGVMVTHESLLANCEAVVDHTPIGVSWLPQYHDMGLIGYYLFFALKGGTTYGMSPMDFVERPALWLEAITKYRATASSAPNFAYEYCLRADKLPPEQVAALDLSSLRFLMTAAEPVRADVFRAFLERFQPRGLSPQSFFAAYGLAEFTLAVTNYGRSARTFDRVCLERHEVQAARAGSHGQLDVTLMSCGVPLGDTEIAIVEVSPEQNQTLSQEPADTYRRAAPGRVGEIWLRGASKARGYYRQDAATAANFAARLADCPPQAAGDWLRSGDLGFVHDGELYVCGRLKDLIILRGINFYPQDIEAIVERCAGVRRGGVVAFGVDEHGAEQLVVVAEQRSKAQSVSSREVHRTLRDGLGVGLDRLVLVPPKTIEKTSSGKLARRLTKERWQKKELTTIAEWTPEANEQSPCSEFALGADQAQECASPALLGLLSAFALTGRERVPLQDAGLDSVQLVAFTQALQHRLRELGHTEVARSVELSTLQPIAVCELVRLFNDLAAATPLSQLELRRALFGFSRLQRERDNDMMGRDAAMHLPELEPNRVLVPRPDAASAATGDRGAILLTGGTGFFGPFLLRSLLEQTTRNIHVLVRGASAAEGLERLRRGLGALEAQTAAPPKPTPGFEERVRAICGDLSRPRLGLSERCWQELEREVEAIYHNGAGVNYLDDYATLRDANVFGTREVLRLAFRGRPKVLNHISTTFVFGWSVQETLHESDRNEAMQHLDFGYSQSKWVAEQLVCRALRHGLPGRVFRPALLTPSAIGGGDNLDISIRLLAFMIKHRLATTARNQVSFCPADVAAHNIVAIASGQEGVGDTVHVTRDQYSSLQDVTEILAERLGTPFQYYPLADFVREVTARCEKSDPLFPLLEFFVRSTDNITRMEFKRYDNANYRHLRSLSPACIPDPPLGEVVDGMLRFMRRQGLLSST